MKLCSECGGEVSGAGAEMSCASCGRSFMVEDGIYSFYNPPGGHTDDGYSDEFFAVNSDREKKHFWFVSRNSFVMRLCARYAQPGARFIEIGCGTGSILEALRGKGLEADGADISLTALKYARSKVAAGLYQADICALPFAGEYDAAVMADVLEHIGDEALALSNVRRALKDGGLLFMTVPACSRLFGQYDKLLYHRRRYDLAPLVELLESSGFAVLKATYLNFFLFPVLYLNRRLRKEAVASGPEEERAMLQKELRIIPVINSLFRFIAYLEELLAMRINLPAGGSIAIVARKKK